MEVTLHLPDKLYEKAQQWAAITQQELDDALTDALEVILSPVHTAPEFEKPVAALTDAEVVAQSEMRLPPDEGQRLSALLAERREGALPEDDQRELFALAGLYQRLWLRQSEALVEAVKRGLRDPLHS